MLQIALLILFIYLTIKISTDFIFFKDEIRAAMDRDPAATNSWVVAFLYPGYRAVKYYRVAHLLLKLRIPILPTFISLWARAVTGIEIHPGAQIGKGIFIDHGMGVVIGETAILGSNVTLYQQVTLGGTGKERGKRHPTLGNNVVVGAGAKVLGNIEIGDDAFIGANAVVVRSAPPMSTIVGVPGRVVSRKGKRLPGINLDHCRLPDPIAKSLQALQHEIDKIEDEVREHHSDDGASDSRKQH